MKIDNECVVSFHFTLKNDEGKILSSSEGQDPLSYLHGAGNMVPGLEKEMAGKTINDKFSVSITPAEGYGEYNDDLIQKFSRDMFEGTDKIEVGMSFHTQTEHGKQAVSVIGFDENTVTVDGNHPLAGAVLHFDLEVTGVREATDEEIEHGRVIEPNVHH